MPPSFGATNEYATSPAGPVNGKLGLALGEIDGLPDGDTEGAAVGLVDGETEGDAVGLVDGEIDGLVDGEALGLLGLKLGDRDGDELGLVLGLSVAQSCWPSPENQTPGQVWHTVFPVAD